MLTTNFDPNFCFESYKKPIIGLCILSLTAMAWFLYDLAEQKSRPKISQFHPLDLFPQMFVFDPNRLYVLNHNRFLDPSNFANFCVFVHKLGVESFEKLRDVIESWSIRFRIWNLHNKNATSTTAWSPTIEDDRRFLH